MAHCRTLEHSGTWGGMEERWMRTGAGATAQTLLAAHVWPQKPLPILRTEEIKLAARGLQV